MEKGSALLLGALCDRVCEGVGSLADGCASAGVRGWERQWSPVHEQQHLLWVHGEVTVAALSWCYRQRLCPPQGMHTACKQA